MTMMQCRMIPGEPIWFDHRKHPFWGHDEYRPYVFVKEMPGVKHYLLCGGTGKTDGGEYAIRGMNADTLFRPKEEAERDAREYLKLNPKSTP